MDIGNTLIFPISNIPNPISIYKPQTFSNGRPCQYKDNQLHSKHFSTMPTFQLTVNGQARSVEADADTPLLWILRDELNLVGTKYGCGIAQCGACTVHVNGTAMRSCSLPVSNAVNQDITTIEGLSEKGDHPVQQAWREHDVPQCGYCQAGQMMSAAALLKENPNPSDTDINEAMRGNICRCGTYNHIRDAVKSAAKMG